MGAIESVFLYRTFLCVMGRSGSWEILCVTYGYSVEWQREPESREGKS